MSEQKTIEDGCPHCDGSGWVSACTGLRIVTRRCLACNPRQEPPQ